MGIHRSTYYRWRHQVLRYGLDILHPRERRRPRMPNSTSPLIEQRVLAFSLAHPTVGPQRISDELRRPKWGGFRISPNGVHKVLRRHGLNTKAKRLGLVAGYAGGWLDGLLMRVTDIVYAFPALLFFIVMQVALGETRFGGMLNGLVLLLVTLSILSWTGIARLVRGATLALKEEEFVLAARAGGAGIGRVIGRHVLPNALGPVIVAAAFLAPGAIVAEAILGYLGIGLRPDVALDAPLPSSWGTMIFDGYRAWQSQAWMLIGPSLAVALTTLACTFVGDGLRDALDVREGR